MSLREVFAEAGVICAPFDDAALERIRDRILDEHPNGPEPWQINRITTDELTRPAREAERRRRRGGDTMKIEIYRREDRLWDWRAVAGNGEIVATSGGQGFTERNDAHEAVDRVRDGLFDAAIVNEGPPSAG